MLDVSICRPSPRVFPHEPTLSLAADIIRAHAMLLDAERAWGGHAPTRTPPVLPYMPYNIGNCKYRVNLLVCCWYSQGARDASRCRASVGRAHHDAHPAGGACPFSRRWTHAATQGAAANNLFFNDTTHFVQPIIMDGLYTKGTRAHTQKELIREWLWEPKGSSPGYI